MFCQLFIILCFIDSICLLYTNLSYCTYPIYKYHVKYVKCLSIILFYFSSTYIFLTFYAKKPRQILFM